MNGKFLDLLPGFVSGAQQIHNLLAGVTFVLAVAGLLLIVDQAFREHSLKRVKGTLVRLIVIIIMLGTLGGWGDILSSAVDDLAAQAGLSPSGGGVFEAYREAVARKFGSDSAAPANNGFQSDGSSDGSSRGAGGDFTVPDGAATGQSAGVKLTRYGYEQPGDANYDSKSAQGIGAFGFDSAPGSLVPLQSAALSPDVAQQYNLVGGQQFTVTTADGQQMNLVYADKTADYLTGRVDIYDPEGQLTNDGAAVTSIEGGPVVANNGSDQPGGGWISKITDSLTIGILWPLVHLLSLVALAIMWLMSGVQQIFYTIEIAVSPIFLGMLMIPRLTGTATRFFSFLVAITLWPLGWAICDLLTRALIALAVNPTNNLGASVFGAGAMMLGYWVLLALWSIGSSILAPLIVSAALVGGSSGIAAVAGATIGATVTRATGGGTQAAVLTSKVAAAPISAASRSVMNAYQNFARRPIAVAGGNGSRQGQA
jgi:hypothetical protein